MSITIVGPSPSDLYPYEAWLQGPNSNSPHASIVIGDAGNTPEEAAFECIQVWRRHNPGELVPDYQMHYRDERDVDVWDWYSQIEVGLA